MSKSSAFHRPEGIWAGLTRRLAGLRRGDKPSLSQCRDRMAALDDPATRKALADLPAHLLRDIGVPDMRSTEAAPQQEGDALRRHLW